MRMLLKTSLREIRQSLGRYLAILAIVGLGVGFFAGLRSSQPAMQATGIDYLMEQRLFDFQTISTLGFTEEDVERFQAIDGVAEARGAVYVDFLTEMEEGMESVVRAHSLTEGVNLPRLKAGRMPEAPNECLADARYFSDAVLGRVLTVLDSNDEDTREILYCGSYTIVGLAWSPYYLNYERGTSSLGSGSVSSFLYIPEEGFDFDAYYEVYLTLEDPGEAYSDAYWDQADLVQPSVERLVEERAGLRYTDLLGEAEEEIRDAKEQIADGWETYHSERTDVDEELQDAYRELTDGEAEYAQALSDYEQGLLDYADGLQKYQDGLQEYADGEAELADARTELDDAERELADAKTELDDAKQELDDAKAELDDGAAELADAKAELDDAERELNDAQRQLDDAKAELDEGRKELDDAKAELDDAKAELDKAAQQLDAARAELASGEAELANASAPLQEAGAQLAGTEAQLNAAKAQLDQTKAALDASRAELDAGEAQYAALVAQGMTEAAAALRAQLDAGEEQYAAGMAMYATGLAQYESGCIQYQAGLAQYNEGLAQLGAAQAQLEEGRAQYQEGLAAYQKGRAEYEQGLQDYEEGRKEYNEGWAEYRQGQKDYEEGRAEYEEGLAAYQEALQKYSDGEAEYSDGLAKYNDGYAEYLDGVAEYEDGLAKYADGEAELAEAKAELDDAERELTDAKDELDRAPAELADARRELDDGWAEYNDGRAEADEEFADAERELLDAEQELADAEEKLADLKPATTYVLTREENTGYVCFDNDTSIIEAISVVFPVFFFLVAALVCMTTMTRMVDEQRTQIGVLKALGYSRGQIMGKYLLYSGSAALLGSGIGYALGANGLPWIFWEIYGIIYGFAPLKPVFLPGLLALSFAAALLCSIGATYLSCRMELARQTAELLRPKTPRAGKRVLLEYVTPVWRRLGFLHKVSVRNVLRYRSRLVMMVLGIGGCTALLCTGFGVRDSIKHVADDQYEEITLYDYAVTFQDEQTPESAAAYLERCGWERQAGLLVHSGTVDVAAAGGSKSVYLVVSASDSLEGFLDLHSGGEPIAYPGPGEVVLNTGLAENLGIVQGDAVRLEGGSLGDLEVTVSGIADNYVFNYAYVSPETYRQQLGQAPEYNTLYVLGREGADPYAEGALLLEDDGVSRVSVNQASREQVDNMLSRLDYVVVVVVLCAGALAFIVLYNLTNINITERIREIATIKVLGFYQNEVASYVFREINILSLLGSLAGLLMGKALHAFVMEQVKIDSMFFACRISPLSYAISLVMTLLFTLAISTAMRPRLRKIDMAESLKSIE